MEENPSLLHVCADGNIEMLIKLIKCGRDPDEDDNRGRTCLHLAASRGREDVLRALVDHGADVKTVDKQGNTPLHYCGHVETINCLLENGADPSARYYCYLIS